jgi:hypothetical protein
MHHPSSRRLALVANRPEPERDPVEADRLPFAMRLTMGQILEVAEDAEIRAEIIEDVTSTLAARDATSIRRVERPDEIGRRVDSLREVAGDLRSIAAQIMDSWAGPERSS